MCGSTAVLPSGEVYMKMREDCAVAGFVLFSVGFPYGLPMLKVDCVFFKISDRFFLERGVIAKIYFVGGNAAFPFLDLIEQKSLPLRPPQAAVVIFR